MLAGDIAAFAYSARIGVLYRARDEGLGGVPTGSELTFALTAGVRLAEHFLIGPELWGSTVISDGDAVFEQETTPLELLFGAHYKSPDVLVSLGVGPGLTKGIGAPSVRVLGSVEWYPVPEAPPEPFVEPEPPPPPDRDGDGIVDAEDACADTPGVANEDDTKHGCPPDRDGDGVADEHDACADVAGEASDDPAKNGCPPDRDGDQIADPDDACPDTPGVASEDKSKHGCPGDRDGDGITDGEDACPDAAGERNSDPEKNGCPLARVERGQIKILERIEFKTNSAELLPASIPLLEAVLEILNQRPEITRVSLEGHTDNVGKPAYNLRLSQRRTDSVLKWLVKNGVSRKRLEAHGFGMTQPLDPSDTPEARDRNRRVEFHIREVDGKPISDVGAADAQGTTP
jgi:outer membrane protein OmpA-like peptidoglycan-associated protein